MVFGKLRFQSMIFRKYFAAVVLFLAMINAAQSQKRPGIPHHVAKSANFTVTTADNEAIFDVTTGSSSITVTFPSAATLTDQFHCVIVKVDAGSGNVLANGQLL